MRLINKGPITVSDPNDSQATQLLNELLENGTASSKKTPGPSPSLHARSVHSHEISSDSFNSSRHSNHLPQYHFHGLASTQTQSQQAGDSEGLDGGSQKENIGANRPNKDLSRLHTSAPSRQGSPHAPPSKIAQEVMFHGNNHSGMTTVHKVCDVILHISL